MNLLALFRRRRKRADLSVVEEMTAEPGQLRDLPPGVYPSGGKPVRELRPPPKGQKGLGV